MKNSREVSVLPEVKNPDADRYPSAKRVVQAVLNQDNFPEGDVERIEITLLASGEATYRVWPARAEEPAGGVLVDA